MATWTRRSITLAAAVVTTFVGLAWRLLPLGLPPFWFKYGGSALWAVMVYWIGAALIPRWPPSMIALAACAVAAVVELSRLYHAPGIDAFRMTLAGKLLLGRFFSIWDIVAYWLAICLAALIDGVIFDSPNKAPRSN